MQFAQSINLIGNRSKKEEALLAFQESLFYNGLPVYAYRERVNRYEVISQNMLYYPV